MGRLFGTDGVRGIANKDLTPELAFLLGRAGAYVLAHRRGVANGGRLRVVIGRDTRVSGQMLEAAMVAGMTSVGVDVIQLGILPTPAVAFMTRHLGVDAGVMISASHNPVEDNGIKFFLSDGFKLPDEVEDEIEELVLKAQQGGDCSDDLPRPVGLEVGRVENYPQAIDEYVEFLAGTVDVDLSGLRIVVDCANGAAYQAAPQVLRRLGAEVITINTNANGEDINVDCGSTHPNVIQAAVKKYQAAVGIAHDGDADRVIAVDEAGEILNGDNIMAVCAVDMLSRSALPKSAIAATVYSNLGLKKVLEQHGGYVIETKNGDRYVLEAMREHGLALGGEQSGHIIFLEHNTTGDGILTALQLLAVMVKKGVPLSQLRQILKPYPQILKNIRVKDKNWESNEKIQQAIAKAEEILGGDGRIFVRASGTEPLVRVMGEAPDFSQVQEAVELVESVVYEELGEKL